MEAVIAASPSPPELPPADAGASQLPSARHQHSHKKKALRAHASRHTSAAEAAASTHHDPAIPLFPGDDGASYALESGILHDRRLCRRQKDAYLRVQHKIMERQDKARAMIVSANVLSMSVMASQLAMYRWKVSEAQTIAEATALLHAEVAEAERKSYCVARKQAPPFYPEERKRKARRQEGTRERPEGREDGGEDAPGPRREGYSKYAAAVAAASSGGEAEEALKKIFAKRVAKSMRRRERDAAGAAAGKPTDAADLGPGGIAAYLNRQDRDDGTSDGWLSSSSLSTSSSTGRDERHADDDDDDDAASSLCSVEHANGRDNADKGGMLSADATPPDAVTRLVLVDCFTHEPFTDIVAHLRYMDRQYHLELVIVLLLPQGGLTRPLSTPDAPPTPSSSPPLPDASGKTSSTQHKGGSGAAASAAGLPPGVADVQGPGVVITPQYDMSIDAAYRAGYDLVLTHYMDHVVVDFLTNTFVSSAGRWRNDVRAKAAVGNYISLKNVLMGRIDIDALRQLVWSDTTDDADLLEAIGTNSLAVQGETKHFAVASQQLSEQQVRQPKRQGASADVLTIMDDELQGSESGRGGGGLESPFGPVFPSSLPHLRSRDVNMSGVRPRSSNLNDNGGRVVPLAGLDGQKDILGAVMQPTTAMQQAARRRQLNGEGAEDSLYDGTGNRAVYMEAVEAEMARLIAENDSKQSSIDLMQNEVERLHKTVAVLRRKLGGAGGEDGLAGGRDMQGGAVGGAEGRAFGRPDSGSLVNLSKEQQIYILKERLEAANERIADLTEGGEGRRARSAAGSRNGLTSAAGRRLNEAKSSGADARRAQLQRKRKHKAALTYHEHREAEFLALHDMDAEWLAAMQADGDNDDDDLSDDGTGRTRRLFGRGKPRPSDAEAAARRREREATDAAMDALQQEILYLQQRGSDAGLDSAEEQRRRMTVKKLEEALNRLQTQKDRIQSLEELRQMDENMFRRQIDQLKFAAARAASASSSRTGRGGGKANPSSHKKGTATKRTEKGGGRFPVTAASASTPGGTAEAASALQKARAKHAKELVALEETLVAAKEEAVAAAIEMERRRARLGQRKRETALRKQLTELFLRIRKPHTAAYRALLAQDYSRASQEARGAWQRMHFSLVNTPATAQRDTDEQTGKELSGPIARIADPVVRERVMRIAREHAHYSLRAERAKQAMEAFDKESRDGEGPASSPRREAYAALVSRHEAQKHAVQEACDTKADPKAYLHELLLLSDLEDALTQYADIDCTPALKHAQTWRCFPIAVEAAERKTAALTQPPRMIDGSPLPTLPTVRENEGAESDAIVAPIVPPLSVVSQAPADGETVPLPPPLAYVPLQDADGLLTAIADVFQVACDGASEASAAAATMAGKTSSSSRTTTKKTEAAVGSVGTKRKNPLSAGAANTAEDGKPPLLDEDGGAAPDGDADKDGANDDDDDATDTREAQRRRDIAVAMASAVPTRDVLNRQQDILVALRQSGASGALTALYEVLQRGFAQGYVHPDRMADVDAHVCLEGSILASPLHSTSQAPTMSHGDASSASVAPDAEFLPPPALVAVTASASTTAARATVASPTPPPVNVELYLAHRQELLRMLRLLALAEPLVAPVIEPYVSEELTHRVEQDVRDLAEQQQQQRRMALGSLTGGGSGLDLSAPAVTLPLLVAADTAVTASVVDLLGTAMAEAMQREGDPQGDGERAHPDAQALAALLRAHTLRHLAPMSEQLTSYIASRSDVVRALQATRRHRLRATPEGTVEEEDEDSVRVLGRLLGLSHTGAGKHRKSDEASSALAADVQAILKKTKKFTGEDDEALLRLFAEQNTTEYTADDLAQMFSKRRRGKGKGGAALTLEDIYLEQADLVAGAEDDDDDDDDDEMFAGEEDENLAAMRSIRLELNYLNAARKQRMAELVLRYRLRQRVRLGQEAALDDAEEAARRRQQEEQQQSLEGDGSPRAVPDFEVKSGSAAWYGMEAAKRVKDILRRRTKPGQIVVGGGPDGGGVGVELSKRTAFPRPPPKEVEILQTAQERLRAAHTALPPLKRRGLSRWQQKHYNGSGLEGPYDEDELGYVYPRDEASLNAFGNVASLYEFDGVDRYMYTPAELTQRVLQYRATVGRAASRVGTGNANPASLAIAQRLGPSYYTPILAGTGGGQSRASAATQHSTDARTAPRQRPEMTTWTYGVPSERVHEVLSQPMSTLAPGSGEAAEVMFLPHRQRSSLAEQQQQQRAGGRHATQDSVPRFMESAPLYQQQQQPLRPSFLAGGAAYSSPAAMAAQHISALLRVSMADPTVAGTARRTETHQAGQPSLLTRRTEPQQPQPPSSTAGGTHSVHGTPHTPLSELNGTLPPPSSAHQQ